jgi:hypothetical protein
MVRETVSQLEADLGGDLSTAERMLVADVALDTLLLQASNNEVAAPPIIEGKDGLKPHPVYQLRGQLIAQRRESLSSSGSSESASKSASPTSSTPAPSSRKPKPASDRVNEENASGAHLGGACEERLLVAKGRAFPSRSFQTGNSHIQVRRHCRSSPDWAATKGRTGHERRVETFHSVPVPSAFRFYIYYSGMRFSFYVLTTAGHIMTEREFK